MAKKQKSVVINVDGGDGWTIYNGDCCEVIRGIPDDSIDYCIHSPPFSSLYIYSASEADMGNSASDDEFFTHYKFLINELHRVATPGRLCSVHCKDLPKYKNRDESAGLSDFPGMIVRAFEECGWTYHSRVTIWKDPVTEMQRTKNHGLLHKQLCKDSSASRQGMADYLLTFRKWDGWDGVTPPKPVTGPSPEVRFEHGSFIGDDRPECRANADREYSIQVWQRYASPVWFDINQMNVLNYRLGKDDKDEKHICPLQLDVINRALHLWTNEGDTVLSPFLGIGSEGYCSVRMGRRFVGIELKGSYFAKAGENIRKAEKERKASKTLPLFAHEDTADA